MYVISFYFVCTVNINLLYCILGRTPQLRRVTREAVTPASVLYRTIGSIRGSITALWAKPMSHGSDLVTAVPTPNAAEYKGKPSCLRLITGLRSVTTANMDTPYNHRRPARRHSTEKIKLTQKMQCCARLEDIKTAQKNIHICEFSYWSGQRSANICV